MKKNGVFTLSILLATATLFGCSSGGGSHSSDETTPDTGTAYYIDSPVAGIDYVCGTQEGVTGQNGEFIFDLGESCTFYLGTVPLRDITVDALQDGASIQETDVTIARVLQSLDADGDPDNGITINAEVVAALADSGITSIPDTEEEVAALFEALEDAGVTLVSEETATAHLLSSILAGATLIDAGYDEEPFLNSLAFDDSLTSVTWTNQLATDSGSATISLDDAQLTVSETGQEDATYTLSLVADEDYLLMVDDNGNEERLYGSLEAAQHYLIGRILAGHTVYTVSEQESYLEAWTCNSTLTESTWDDGAESGTVTISSLEGSVMTVVDGDRTITLTVTEITPDYLAVTSSLDGSLRLYYDQAAAETYFDSLADNGEVPAFTLEMLTDQVWYTNDFYQITFDTAASTLTSRSLVNTEDEDGSEDIPFTITDGSIIAGDNEETVSLVSSGDSSYRVTLTDNASQESETLTFYTSLAAFEASLYDDISTVVTVSDASDDSTDTQDRAGFELESLSVVETSGNLVITLTTAGDIASALNSTPTAGYTNEMWIEINNYFEFGLSSNGSQWFKEDTYLDGEFIGGTDVSTNDYSYSVSGNTVTLTVATDIIPANSYLSLRGQSGIDQQESINEAEDQITFDEIRLGALWSSDAATGDNQPNHLVGAWVYNAEGYPFDIVLVVTSDGYIAAQQRLGEEGVIGGIETGTYTLVDENTLSDAVTIINSNAGDTAVGATVTVDGTDATTAIVTIAGEEVDGATITKLVSTDDHPEAGAWINSDGNINGDGETAVVLILDGNGHYMEADLNDNYTGFHEINGIIHNATEFGSYVLNSDGSVTVTPDTQTDIYAPLVCTDGDGTDCGTVAGDSNGDAGFSTLSADIPVDISADGTTLTMTVTEEDGSTSYVSFQKVQ